VPTLSRLLSIGSNDDDDGGDDDDDNNNNNLFSIPEIHQSGYRTCQ